MSLADAYARFMASWYWSRMTAHVAHIRQRASDVSFDAVQLRHHERDSAVLRGCTKLEERIRKLMVEINRMREVIADLEDIQTIYTAETREYRRRNRRAWYAPLSKWRKDLADAWTSIDHANELIRKTRRSHVT